MLLILNAVDSRIFNTAKYDSVAQFEKHLYIDNKTMIWELIRANKRKSIFLLLIMAVVLLSLGATIGLYLFGNKGLTYGSMIAAGVFFFLALLSYAGGDSILLTSVNASRITKDLNPQLFNIVEEMTIAASLPKMPDIYIIPDRSPNAFAIGRNPKCSSIAVTVGLLARLNRDELQGVIAHEISHIVHRDTLYMTIAGIMLGAIIMISDAFTRGMFYSSTARRYSGSRKNNGQGLVLILALVASILAPILAMILYYSLSRRREYLADAGAARLTRYPEGLASALERISLSAIPMESANKVTAPMYIAPPLKTDEMSFAGLGSTHPPIQDRIKILRSMTHGASYKDYTTAFAAAHGRSSSFPKTMLTDNDKIELRPANPTAAGEPQTIWQRLHESGDLARAAKGFTFVTCTCGLKIKVPPQFKKTQFACPRCKKTHFLEQHK